MIGNTTVKGAGMMQAQPVALIVQGEPGEPPERISPEVFFDLIRFNGI